MAIMSFLNTTKYPPSLLFLSMTLGPAMILLVLFEHWTSKIGQTLSMIGKVSLFFYLLHVPVIKTAAHIWTSLNYDMAGSLLYEPSVGSGGYHPKLMLTYLAWIALLFALYYPSRWFASVKAKSNNKWLSYF